jgi:hypothetical protein
MRPLLLGAITAEPRDRLIDCNQQCSYIFAANARVPKLDQCEKSAIIVQVIRSIRVIDLRQMSRWGLEQLDDIVLRKNSGVASAQQNFVQSAISIVRLDDAETALALVADAGQAVRKIETESRDAITRATNAALVVKERHDPNAQRVLTLVG